MEKEQQEEQESLNLFNSTQTIIQQALTKLGYNNEMYELLKEPIRLLTVRIPVRMDDGTGSD
jgi:glutamate dehydrogenase